jgi:hypothetical protein
VSAYEGFQLVVVLLMLTVFALTRAADRYPHVPWLRKIRQIFPKVSDEQRRKFQRRSNIYTGFELILVGVALPIGFLALKVMMFSDISTTEVVLVGAGSLLCIVLGIIAVAQNRR